MGQLPKGSIQLIETSSDVDTLNRKKFTKPVAYITQTTLSVDDTAEIINKLKDKFPDIKQPIKKTYVMQQPIDKWLLKTLQQSVIYFSLLEAETRQTP